jgi:hypothetical protein
MVGALVAVAFSANAQNNQPAVTAELLSKRLPEGELGQMIVKVVNGRPEAMPAEIPVEGLKIVRSEKVDQKFQFGTGGNKSEFHFYFSITTTKAGEYTIPVFPVRVDGVEHQTKPLTLTVYARDPNDPALDASRPYFANLKAETRELWAGQVTPLTLTIFVRGARSINDIGPAMLRHDAFVFDYTRAYTLDAVEIDGITFTTARRDGSVFGLTPGSYDIEPAEIGVAMVDESSPIGRLPGFFQNFTTRTLRTNPISLTVKPLPENGKPASFRGGVGQFEIAAKASPLDISVGDPVTIDLEIKGPGNYVSLEAPVFQPADPKQWRTYEARKTVDPEEMSDGVTPGRATFTQIVMPQAEVAEIPAFEFAFFNPLSGAYETRRTATIPLKVSPDARLAQAAAAVIPSTDGGPLPIVAKATPDAEYNDILHIRTTDPEWRPFTGSITARPLFWAGQIVPGLALLSLLGIAAVRRIRSRRRPETDRSVTVPFKTALHAVSAATGRRIDFYRAIDDALDSWAAEAGPNVEKSLPDPLKNGLQALRARSQQVVYGAHQSDDTTLSRPADQTESAEAIQILEALRKRLS